MLLVLNNLDLETNCQSFPYTIKIKVFGQSWIKGSAGTDNTALGEAVTQESVKYVIYHIFSHDI